ncbi:MAG: ABC transporter substrate-binding protein [Vicinamibacterales bacterium]
MTRALKLAVLLILAAAIVIAGWSLWARRPAPDSPADTSGGRLIASLRSEPARYNRYVEGSAAADLVSLLTDGRLVRVNRATDVVEPALAERWAQSDDGLTFTLTLRRDVRFSDGAPFTSADVLFSARALYDPAVNSPLASATRIGGKPLVFAAPDPWTVTVTLPAPFAPGLRLLENLPLLPRHKLEGALDAGTFADAWRVGTPLTEITGLGPFMLTEHVSGQRLVFARNPHYWRRDAQGTPLPYLDGITVLIVQDQNTEALRMAAGEIDVMSNADIRPEDIATFTRAADEGRLRLHEVGIGLDPNLLWFNLTEESRDRLAWLHDTRVRQAISHAVDRQALANTVYLGAAVPIHGPVSPGNRTWYSASAPQWPYDPARAKALLADAGLADTNGDGMLDIGGRPARFSILTQAGNTLRERSASLLQEQLRQVGLAVDIVTLDQGALGQRWMQGAYDSIYFGVQASATDPALNLDLWLSSGNFHFWNPNQPSPATAWEAEIDDLMHRNAVAATLAERQQLFAEVQRILGEQLPAIYFVAPRVTIAVRPRVRNLTPVLQAPQLLWNAETLAVDARQP